MKALLLFVLTGILHAPPIPVRTPGVSWVQQRIFDGLSRLENCRAWNNPGCLKHAHQPGARRGRGGYAVFRTLVDGQRELRRRIALWSGRSVADFLRGYNPGVEGYVEKVERIARLDGEERL